MRLPGGKTHTFLVGAEKGVDVRLAIDIIRLSHQSRFDVALIISQDQDLSEVADEIRVIAGEQKRWMKVASAFPSSPTTRRIRGECSTPTGSKLIARLTMLASIRAIIVQRGRRHNQTLWSISCSRITRSTTAGELPNPANSSCKEFARALGQRDPTMADRSIDVCDVPGPISFIVPLYGSSDSNTHRTGVDYAVVPYPVMRSARVFPIANRRVEAHSTTGFFR